MKLWKILLATLLIATLISTVGFAAVITPCPSEYHSMMMAMSGYCQYCGLNACEKMHDTLMEREGKCKYCGESVPVEACKHPEKQYVRKNEQEHTVYCKNHKCEIWNLGTEAHNLVNGVCLCGYVDNSSNPPAVAKHEGCLNPAKCDGSVKSTTVKKAATCTDKGSIEYKYSCGKTETEEIPANGHDYKNGVCNDCGTEDPNYNPPVEAKHEGCLNPAKCDGSIASVDVKKAATCTEKGSIEYKYGCGKTETAETPANGHDYENGKCNECDAKDPNHEPPVAAQHEGCLNPAKCDGSIVSVDVKKAATCTEKGSFDYKYSCGKTESEEIPANGHDYKNGVCNACGAKDPNYVPPVEAKHDGCLNPAKCDGKVKSAIVVKAATCTAKGSVEYKYSCGKTETEVIPATGHEYANDKCVVCGKKASKYYYNNTMTSYGPTTRELVGGSDWYRVTPVDLTVDGIYTYDLIASNRYVLGTVTIYVKSGALTVNYKITATDVDVKAESLLIYSSKDALAEGEAVSANVGAAIDIAGTFADDTKVIVSLILTGDYDAMAHNVTTMVIDEAEIAAMIANID